MVIAINGWNYVFYIGNLFADIAIAAFAIKISYFDKKSDDLEKYLMGRLESWRRRRDDIHDVIIDVYLKASAIEGKNQLPRSYFDNELEDMKSLYHFLESIGEKEVMEALGDDYYQDYKRKSEIDKDDAFRTQNTKIRILSHIFITKDIDRRLAEINTDIGEFEDELLSLVSKRENYERIVPFILGTFGLGIVIQLTALAASGLDNRYPLLPENSNFMFLKLLYVLILAFAPAIPAFININKNNP